jgi:hypothetical protein
MANDPDDNPTTMDPKEEFLRCLQAAFSDGTLLRLSLGKYRGEEPDLRRISARCVSLKGEDYLSFTDHYKTRDVTRNVVLNDAPMELERQLETGFKSAHLFTSDFDLQLEFNRRGKGRLSRSRATQTKQAGQSHDRSKKRLVDPGSAWLQALGVTNAQGRVLPSMSDKWRQINKFVEILDSSVKASPLAGREGLKVIDFGSGKGYLTFSMHAHLHAAKTLGVELRGELVDKCNAAAKRSKLKGLLFEAGDIGNCDQSDIDLMVALHACDTATDLAIHQGISKRAGLILCVPCCHQEVRPQIKIPEVLLPVLRHGIHLGTEADMVTDTMRALLLEASGYSVKVFEFISLEHTSKNKMISAVKNGSTQRAEAAREEFSRLKEFYGIREQRLAELLQC